MVQEFRQVCLASGGDFDNAAENAEKAGFSRVSGELGKALGFKEGSRQSAFLKNNPYGQGSLIVSLALNEIEGQSVVACGLLAPHDFKAMNAEIDDFFGTPPKVAFINNGIRTAAWTTLVNGESTDVILNDMSGGEPMTQLSVIAPTVKTTK